MTRPEDDDDCIQIEQLRASAHLGVTQKEREASQSITLSLTLWPTRRFTDLHDEVANTVDYSTIAQEVRDLVRQRSDKLIETLAERIAEELLERFPLLRIRVELRKYVLEDAAHVAVVLTRTRKASP